MNLVRSKNFLTTESCAEGTDCQKTGCGSGWKRRPLEGSGGSLTGETSLGRSNMSGRGIEKMRVTISCDFGVLEQVVISASFIIFLTHVN